MFNQLTRVKERYHELEKLLTSPEVLADAEQIGKLGAELAEVKPVVEKVDVYQKLQADVQDNEEIIRNESDEELIEMAKEELSDLKNQLPQLEEELKVMLLPKDPRDSKNVIVEIRAGTGGEEAGLFANELLRAYLRYADERGWNTEIISKSDSGIGGVKEAVVKINGHGAYSRLKFESGTHRVQRIPATESGGRIHTSAVTVAILPEAEEVDIQISQNDLKIDIFRSSGPGGQSVNTTDSAVRITHVPSGLVVTCQDEKSQLKNKQRAMSVLRSRLYALEYEKNASERESERKSQVGTGDRSQKIRTYNFPQDRVTDHRISHSISNLPGFMDGALDQIIDPLILAHQAELLANQAG